MNDALGFSKDWTDEERLKIVILLANSIQDDIAAGRYGAPLEPQVDDGAPVAFRPNMQSIVEIIAVPANVLEAQRTTIEKFVRDALTEMDQDAEEFFTTSLAEQRKRIELIEDGTVEE